MTSNPTFHDFNSPDDIAAFSAKGEYASIWDCETGSEIYGHKTQLREYLERDPARYHLRLPDGMTPGPLSGVTRRIVL